MFGGHYEWLGAKEVMSFDFVLSCSTRWTRTGTGLAGSHRAGQGGSKRRYCSALGMSKHTGRWTGSGGQGKVRQGCVMIKCCRFLGDVALTLGLGFGSQLKLEGRTNKKREDGEFELSVCKVP